MSSTELTGPHALVAGNEGDASEVAPAVGSLSPTPAIEGVTDEPSVVIHRTGVQEFGFTQLEHERMEMLLQPNVKTYADAAKRLGITEAAMKQTMSRVLFRYRKAKIYCNSLEYWKRKRKEARMSGRKRNR